MRAFFPRLIEVGASCPAALVKYIFLFIYSFYGTRPKVFHNNRTSLLCNSSNIFNQAAGVKQCIIILHRKPRFLNLSL